jgi:hypothetical protein
MLQYMWPQERGMAVVSSEHKGHSFAAGRGGGVHAERNFGDGKEEVWLMFSARWKMQLISSRLEDTPEGA